MGETVIVNNDLSLSSSVDLTDFDFSDREIVSYENAAINIDNATDVIVGPVTQFNVNGNVTFVHNGNPRQIQDGENEKKKTFSSEDAAKTQKDEKVTHEDQNQKAINEKKVIYKNLLAVITSLIFIAVIITVVIIETKTTDDVLSHINSEGNTTNLGRHQVLTKNDWLGRDPKMVDPISPPVKMVIIKHTGGGTCQSFQVCAGKVQTIQGTSIAQGLPDIYCNFLIGGDGNIYVGRGWDVRNDQRDSTIDVVFMGNFDIDDFSESMEEAALLLIEYGIKIKKLDPTYIVVCHNQTKNVRSPGQNVFKSVTHWPHYDSGLYFSNSLEKPSTPTKN